MTSDQRGDFKQFVRERADRPEPDRAADREADGLLDEFERTGIVKLTGVFSADSAAVMREAVWQGWADTYGVRRDDPMTWQSVPSFKTLKAAKRHPSFREVLGEPLRMFADRLVGAGWSTANGFGNLLASFPNTTDWYLPGAGGMWHSDYAYRSEMEPLPGLRVFAVFGDVPPGGGGTLLVGGSHRMVARFVQSRPEIATGRAKIARAACHSSNPWLRDLTKGDPLDQGRIERFMDSTTDVDGIGARVIEACGSPGDVYVCHPWTIHCAGPNANTQPRFLRSPTIRHRPPDDST